jgi:hypothetical protein
MTGLAGAAKSIYTNIKTTRDTLPEKKRGKKIHETGFGPVEMTGSDKMVYFVATHGHAQECMFDI